jgi:hypothetical protein
MKKFCKKCNTEFTYYILDSSQYMFYLNKDYCSEECYRESYYFKRGKEFHVAFMLSLSKKQRKLYDYFETKITSDEADYIVSELDFCKKEFDLIARKLKIKNLLK